MIRFCAPRAPASQTGLTLVELMVALALGMVITGAVLSLFLSSSQSAREDEQYRLKMESGRYAANLLRNELRMVDFWGMVVSIDDIVTSLTPTSGGCADTLGLMNQGQALLLNDGHDSTSTPQFTACAAMTTNQVAGTDQLVIKKVTSEPTARAIVDRADLDGDGDTGETLTLGASDLETGVVYLRATATDGRIIADASSANAPALGESDWRLDTRAYFIRDHFRQVGDGIPSLCRLSTVGTGLGNVETSTVDQAECLVPGIQDFNIELGLDTDNNGTVDRYTETPSVSEMERAVSARISVLARAQRPITGYQNSKTYRLGMGTFRGPYNDGFYRSLFSVTVALRNPINLSRLR